MIKVKVEGVEALKKKLGKLGPKSHDAMVNALSRCAGDVMNEAQKLVPVVTGRLRSSAYVRTVKRNKTRTDFDMGYEAPYAVYVHEIPGGRGYKWLVRAALKVLRGGKAKNAVAQELRKLFKEYR